MAAIVKVVPKKDWEIIKKYLGSDGVVLIPEDVAKQEGVEHMDYEEVSYNFGGEADVWMDVVCDGNHHVMPILKGENIE